ncbi:hypothetical protein LshimejAT787_1700840 [Lyophyllum shimeji]|uniref:Uncharacterized protein n=1 Tax=Lyophyllum shimeji TaxID=47721 RepID=A0A9P3UTR8_LYOSH|nr:hypothetical protein LshimejAT787_1700840 [Lyophyllum shimeji]
MVLVELAEVETPADPSVSPRANPLKLHKLSGGTLHHTRTISTTDVFFHLLHAALIGTLSYSRAAKYPLRSQSQSSVARHEAAGVHDQPLSDCLSRITLSC